jgi:hypothetical protein
MRPRVNFCQRSCRIHFMLTADERHELPVVFHVERLLKTRVWFGLKPIENLTTTAKEKVAHPY